MGRVTKAGNPIARETRALEDLRSTGVETLCPTSPETELQHWTMQMANNQPFFAIVEEQRCWLDDLVREQDVWCVATFLGDRPSIVLDRHALASLSFELGTGPALLNIGRTDLAPEPVWRMAERRRLVDMIRSRAIQYNPSLVRGDTILDKSQKMTAFWARHQSASPSSI